VDVHDKIDELAAMVENARAMPMSASCIVNRAEMLAAIEELRELLPEEFHHASVLLSDREAVVAEGRLDAQRVIEEAHLERERMLSQTEIVAEAGRMAEQVKAAAAEEALAMRNEVDDYVDTKLANFEVALHKTLAAVHRGREKLQGRTELGELRGRELADDPED
jgi:cell division septum initiation protein DivIVA